MIKALNVAIFAFVRWLLRMFVNAAIDHCDISDNDITIKCKLTD